MGHYATLPTLLVAIWLAVVIVGALYLRLRRMSRDAKQRKSGQTLVRKPDD